MSQEIILQDFDRDDSANQGRPWFFDVDTYLLMVEQMIVSDEVDRALWMLDNMPGWYRDNVPMRAKLMREQLLKKLYTSSDYAQAEPLADIEALIRLTRDEINQAWSKPGSRAQVALALCLRLNNEGLTPHITECAPGSYWLPIFLKKNDIEFAYSAVSLNSRAPEVLKDYLHDHLRDDVAMQAQVFVCFELLEHLRFPTEILQYALKANKTFTHILLSTPKYTVSSANPEWYNADLGHLRTYTPREFAQFATSHWPEFKWKLHPHEVMVLEGER